MPKVKTKRAAAKRLEKEKSQKSYNRRSHQRKGNEEDSALPVIFRNGGNILWQELRAV